MDLTASPIQQAVITASALLAAVIGILGTLRRGHWVTTLLFSSAFLAVAALQAGVLGLLHADSGTTARNWATLLKLNEMVEETASARSSPGSRRGLKR